MKISRDLLNQIIKEELGSVLNEVNIMPDPSRTNIPFGEQLVNFIDLLDSGREDMINQARVFVDAYDGDPTWIDEYLEFKEQSKGLRTQQTDWFNSKIPGYQPWVGSSTFGERDPKKPWIADSPIIDDTSRDPTWSERLKFQELGMKTPMEALEYRTTTERRKAFQAEQAGNMELAELHNQTYERLRQLRGWMKNRGTDQYAILKAADKVIEKRKEEERKLT